jgi:transketolase
LTLAQLVESDPSIVLVIGDVGFSFLEPFKEKYPKQFLNTGAMEQSMMGIAAGLARAGLKPYVYTMTNFVLIRPYEQVRNDICYANANVKLFGVKGSAAYKFLGMSHNLYGSEEVDLLKNLPNLNWKIPEEEDDVEQFMLEEYKREGPAYCRL